MKDVNEVKFSGIIERLKSVSTKSGIAMAVFFLIVGKEKFKIVAFKNVAEAILKLKDGACLSVAGAGSINSWKDKDDHWHNDFQLTAWVVEVDGKQIDYEKTKPIPPQHDDLSQYDGQPGDYF